MYTKKCPTGKIGYPTKQKAKNALWTKRHYSAFWEKKIRVYECVYCQNWHLTISKKQPLKQGEL